MYMYKEIGGEIDWRSLLYCSYFKIELYSLLAGL